MSMLEEIREAGQSKGIPAKTEVKVGAEIEEVILEMAHKEPYDLIILGTDVRAVSDRLFLGPRVERILRSAPCPVIVLNTI
jgi:nucleotide-binding universal stress UspA family protein